jgi:hypothetical protein
VAKFNLLAAVSKSPFNTPICALWFTANWSKCSDSCSNFWICCCCSSIMFHLVNPFWNRKENASPCATQLTYENDDDNSRPRLAIKAFTDPLRLGGKSLESSKPKGDHDHFRAVLQRTSKINRIRCIIFE